MSVWLCRCDELRTTTKITFTPVIQKSIQKSKPKVVLKNGLESYVHTCFNNLFYFNTKKFIHLYK